MYIFLLLIVASNVFCGAGSQQHVHIDDVPSDSEFEAQFNKEKLFTHLGGKIVTDNETGRFIGAHVFPESMKNDVASSNKGSTIIIDKRSFSITNKVVGPMGVEQVTFVSNDKSINSDKTFFPRDMDINNLPKKLGKVVCKLYQKNKTNNSTELQDVIIHEKGKPDMRAIMSLHDVKTVYPLFDQVPDPSVAVTEIVYNGVIQKKISQGERKKMEKAAREAKKI